MPSLAPKAKVLGNEVWLLVTNWYIRVAELLKTEDLRKLGKFRTMLKLHGSIT